MADIPTAEIIDPPLDPHEELDFKFELHDVLEADEEISAAGWTLEIPVEGAGMGLVIMTGSGRDPALTDSNQAILFWLTVQADMRADATSDGAGTTIPLRVTGTTNSVPARTRQRTAKVKVAHQ